MEVTDTPIHKGRCLQTVIVFGLKLKPTSSVYCRVSFHCTLKSPIHFSKEITTLA